MRREGEKCRGISGGPSRRRDQPHLPEAIRSSQAKIPEEEEVKEEVEEKSWPPTSFYSECGSDCILMVADEDSSLLSGVQRRSSNSKQPCDSEKQLVLLQWMKDGQQTCSFQTKVNATLHPPAPSIKQLRPLEASSAPSGADNDFIDTGASH
ncbi:unnamed protein product [Pleuronectes platessa]|uniref:Uncharacterized protein n=1 Tax=Pleuronectes platessa TaxID=8262 RepID=A0A9N7UPW8_PLEPL|nr:unnamed protein product [Pleuronectes platessa]